MEKINVAELLRGCPKGTELYSPMYGLGILTKVTDRIHVKFPKEHNVKCFRPDGKVSEDGEIMLYPKDKTTWEGFQQPFKDGDVVVNASNKESNAFIYAGEDNKYYKSYVGLSTGSNPILKPDKSCAWVSKISGIRLATEEEKQKLFDVIKENGYKWNAETKTLENWRAKGLQPYKEDTLEEIKIVIPKGYEFAGVDDDKQQVVFTKIVPKYPKNY